MDNIVNNLLQSALSPSKTENKRQSVLEQSLRKNQDVLGEIGGFNPLGSAATNVTGGGSRSQNLLEIDMSTLSNDEIRQRYGEYGDYLIQQRDSGVSDYLRNASAYRTDAQAFGDTALDVGMGVGSLAHLAPLAMELSNSPLGSAIATSLSPLGIVTSALPDNASVATSEAINAAFDWARGLQSDSLQKRRENYQARQFGDARDNRMDYGSDGVMNTLKRVGRDALDAVENTVEDPALVLSGLSQAGGSLIAGGVLGRGVAATTSRLPGAQKIVEAANKAREAGRWTGARAAHALGQNAATGSVIAGMETGGVYSDTVSRIMEMSHEQLLETSAYYRKAFEMLGDPEKAKESTARAAARKASSQMAPVAAATGLIAGRFESSPLARRGVRSAAQNIGLETTEEAIQGTAAPLTTNLAVRDFADPSMDALEGVGEGTGLGALYGAGIAGTLQAPGVAAQKVYDGAKYVGEKLTARIDSVEQEIKNSSPVSTAQLAPVATELNANIAQAQETLNEAVSTLPPEQQEQASEYINSLISLGSFTEGQYQNPILDAVTQGATSKLEALQRIGEMIANPEVDAESRVLGALEILLTQDATLAAASHNIQAYEQLSDDSPAAQVVSGILGVTQQILNNPEVKDAVEVAVKILQESPPTIAPVTPESINTPEGQQNIDLAVKVAQVAPEKGNLEANQQILYHATNGDISLTPAQMQALEISNALIQAERNSQALGNTLKLSEDALRVNKEITLEGGRKGKSIADHARGIYHALLNNDQEAATQYVTEMRNFAEHMLNKADALNQHIQEGPNSPRVGYRAWNPTARVWFDVEGTKEQGMFLRPNSKASMDMAKTVFHEASLAADVYNNMVDAVGIGTKVTPPNIPQIVLGTPAPTRAAPTTTERIPVSLHRDIADALGVSITRVRAYSKGQDNALTDDQIQQSEYLIEGVEGITPTQPGNAVKVTQTSTEAPVDTPLDQVIEDVPAPEQIADPVEELTSPTSPETTTTAEDSAPAEPSAADQEFSFDSIQESTEQPTTARSAFKLNKGQQKAYDAVVSFLGSDKTTFSIIGSAGTGKTTIVNEILKNPATKKFSRVVLTSPTHRANAVTLSNNPDKNVLTLHKLLGLSPEVDIENFDAKSVKFDLRDIEGVKMQDGDLIIIDESSMINDSLFDALVNVAESMPNTKIIFLGDSAQLGPVNQANKSKALTSTTGSVELTEVMRAKNAELLDESIRVRNKGTFSNKSNMNNGSGVQFIGNSATFLKRAIDLFKSDSFKDNPLLGRVVAFTNAKVAEYNRRIRQELFPDNPDYVVGDLLMGYAAFGRPSTTTGLTTIANGMDYVVKDVGKVRNKTVLINNQQVSVPVIQLTIEDVLGINGTKTIDVVPPSMPEADREALANKLGGLINAARTDRSLWKQYYGFKEQFVLPFDLTYENRGRRLNAAAKSIDYGYAHTIHKSQGGTYNYVLVDNVDINKARDPATRQQLRYVGLTRAQHGSFVLTNDPITDASPAETLEAQQRAVAETPQTESETVDTGLFDKSKIKTTLDAVRHVFNSTGLNYVGTLKEYSDYLKDLTKNSSVQKILFHYSEKGGLNPENKLNKEERALFFFDSIKNAQLWSDWSIKDGPIIGEILLAKAVIPSNKTEIISKDLGGFEAVDAVIESLGKGNEGVILKNVADFGVVGEQIAIDRLDSVVVLGSNQDIDSFRQWKKERESKSTTETIQELAEPETVVETPQTEAETPTAPLTGLASVYQKLIGVADGTNLFVKSFKYPKNQRTRLVGEEQPIQAVLDILNDSESLTDTLGDKWTSRVDDRVLGSWKALLNKSQAISRDVAKMFDAAINHEKVTIDRKTKARKTNPSLLAQLKSGKPVNKYTTGLLFNIAEFFTTSKGRETAVLNPELLQLASLAMTDWVINSSLNREILDREKALNTANGMLRTNAVLISPEAHTMLNEGTTPEDAIRDLGSKITKYWGLQEDANGFIGDQQGIPQSLARMFIEDLIQKGHIVSNSYVMGEVDGVIRLVSGAPQAGQISVIKWSLVEGNILDLPEDHVKNIIKTRTLLEEIVSLDPEITYYVGDGAIPPVSQHQLRQPLVPLTRQQKAVLKKANATEYRIDPMMVSLFGLIGKDQLVEYFGGQDTSDEHLFNKNHLKSVDGQRKGISAAYDALRNLLLEIGSVAEAEGKAPEDVVVRFKHEFASVNRLFLQGPYNPQSSKLMRDALLPTWTVADMTQQKNQDFFYLALAQGLGISIHKQSHADSIQQVFELLTGDITSKGKPTLKDAVPLVQKMMDRADTSKLLDQTDGVSLDQIKGIFDDAGIPFNFLALKSLMEYVNFTRAEDLTQFKSSLYIEADGMTNGPANAMMLFNSGSFTEHWVENMERVGYYINQPDATANSKNPGLPDMYQTGANALVSAIEAHKASLDADWKRASVDNLHRLISMFNPDFGFNDNDELTVGRGFLKNPLMVMIYGSGPGGVANSITDALLDSIYERISEALHRQAQNPGMDFAEAMFPDSANPNQEFEVFQARLGSAVGRKNFRLTDPVNFTLPPELTRKLQTNVKFNLVDSMYAAIRETVGVTVFANVNTMKTAISHMSEYAGVLQKQLIQRQTQLYKENEEGYTPRQLLKKKDLAEIEEKLKRVSAYIEAAHQNFLVTDHATYTVAQTTSEGFHSNSARISGTIPGFAGAGVAGVAYMNQGSGDAQMVQFGYVNGGSEMSRVIPAFDGMHFPFTDMEAGGKTMNDAVAASWKLNPMQAVSDAFSRFMEEVNQDLLTEEQQEEFPNMRETLKTLAAEIQKNHDILSMVPSTIDQMAGTGATHQNQGTESIVSTDIAGITEELNALRDGIKEDVAPATIRQLIAPKGRPATWVQTIYADALPKFLEGNFLNQDQKNVLQDVLNGKYLKDWEIMIGSPRSLKDLVRRRGIGTAQIRQALNSGNGGFTIPGSKQIFIMNDSAETVLHEVIHAATYQKVLDHVEGRTNNVAVERIQGMMDQFMELTVDDYGHLAATAVQASALQRAIREARKQGNEAVAINEFMAWTLSNRQLIELAKRQTLPKILQIAKDAWAMLKELIFGKKFAPSVGSDMYSNLRFNTALIVQTNLTVSELSSTGPTLYHETSRVDPDLQKLDQALQRVVVDQLRIREGATAGATDLSRELIISEQAADAVASAFFDMTAEEVEVFKTTVQALTVEQNLDRNITREANRLYSQVMKNLKVEDFMPEDADPSERAYANAKYSLLAGASFNEIDGAGRSTILPVFFGLAMTSREFKDVLSRMQMPKGTVSEETGVDGMLENFGYKAIEALGSKLAGTGTATNIQQAMNILGNKIIENQEARENRFETPGRWIDKVNDVVVELANNFANSLSPELSDAEKAQRTKWDKGLDGAKSALALLISEDIGARVAEDTTAAIDARANLHHWFRELAADLVGRTKSNALIYDMIKQVRSTIQAIRQNYRVNLPKHLKKQFTRSLTEGELASLHRGVIKSDLGKLRLLRHSKQDIALWASNESARRSEIKRLEDSLAVSRNAPTWIEKSKQLAHWMNTGEHGINLLRNAEAIVDLLGTGEKLQLAEGQTRENVLRDIDTLVTLYSIDTMDQVDKDNLSSLVQTEPKGMDYILSYMGDILKTEQERITPESKYNAYKGFAPFSQKPNTSLVVGHETQHADLIAKGYVKVGDFVGANAYLSRGQAYYSMPASAKAAFNQGIIQTAKATTFGVDPSTGYSIGYVVNRITDPVQMKRMLQRQNPANPLIPIYDGEGQLRAVEQVMEPRMLNTVQDVQDATETIGKWKGRQEEEILSQEVNKALIDRLKAQLDADPNKDRYEDVFKSTDPVIKDAVANIPAETRAYIEKVFGKEFLVQRNMLRDVLGYRDASVRDAWTGVTRMPKSTQTAIRNMATAIMGKDAYRNMVRAEEIIENLASNAKVLIAIKSGIVPALNIVSNLVHLVARGVPLAAMGKGIPVKLKEIREYTQSRIKMMELEADYAAATLPNQRASIQAQMQAIEDGHRRLSIWPLIEAGEFTAISDVDLRDADTRIISGKWAEYFDEAVAKMPPGFSTAGRYFLVSKDTALFNGMQKAVEYGDLVAKSILYDDLVSRGRKTKEEALGIITEEFVNYDRLPGRARGKLEKVGLMWFYNFKLRSVKVALSTLRNNPVHALLALAVPTDFGVGDAGIPVEDNAVTMGLEGRLSHSIGPGQGLSAPALNPWLNVIN